MRPAVAALVLATATATSTAHGQPAPRACQVTVVRAPDNVRLAIESWVRGEPRCATSLEVRAVTTDGGVYLFARDDGGRVYERVVPDAESAAVLVASWMAYDGVSQAPAPALPPPPPAPPAATAIVSRTEAPGAAPLALASRPAPPVVTDRRWLTVGAIVDADGAGVRGDIDVWRRGRWAIGAGLAVTTADFSMMSFDGLVTGTSNDGRVLGLGSWSYLSAGWQVRIQGGVGVVYTDARTYFDGYTHPASGLFPVGETSLLLGHQLGQRWALAIGPTLTVYMQQLRTGDPFTGRERLGDLMLYTGLRRRL